MNKINIATIAGAIALAGGLAALPASPALAQSGSRLCGKYAIGTNARAGEVYGWLVELRQDSSTYNSDCDFAIQVAEKNINKVTPELKNMNWTTAKKTTCEDVGQNFKTASFPVDMCGKMEVKKVYYIFRVGGFTEVFDKGNMTLDSLYG